MLQNADLIRDPQVNIKGHQVEGRPYQPLIHLGEIGTGGCPAGIERKQHAKCIHRWNRPNELPVGSHAGPAKFFEIAAVRILLHDSGSGGSVMPVVINGSHLVRERCPSREWRASGLPAPAGVCAASSVEFRKSARKVKEETFIVV